MLISSASDSSAARALRAPVEHLAGAGRQQKHLQAGFGLEVTNVGASSRTMWALVPPTPKALTPARRAPFHCHGPSSPRISNGPRSRCSSVGLGLV